ncbi:MAG: hypothetical protein ACI9EF_003800, partial [Pseudohongiellaceae bacterium]
MSFKVTTVDHLVPFERHQGQVQKPSKPTGNSTEEEPRSPDGLRSPEF